MYNKCGLRYYDLPKCVLTKIRRSDIIILTTMIPHSQQGNWSEPLDKYLNTGFGVEGLESR